MLPKKYRNDLQRLKDNPNVVMPTKGAYRRYPLSALRGAIAAQSGGKPEMITAEKIPDSHIIFLDEIFKAGEGV